MPRIVEPDQAGVVAAAKALRAGRVVAFPTETVYGLGADTLNVAAVRRVYELKARPTDNPLIAHVTDVDAAKAIAAGWDGRCTDLAACWWPGPLTLVLRRAGHVPPAATAGLDTIAVRAPSHPIAVALLETFGGAISAPSANRSGRVSPTTAAHVAADFDDVDDLLILDGGPCEVGIESTVLDMTSEPPRILRPGSITAAALREVIGEVIAPRIEAQVHSPGTSERHYAPRTPTALVDRAALAASLAQIEGRAVVLCRDPSLIAPPHEAVVLPDDPQRYAARLYAALREADARGAAKILVERPPADDAWAAVHDRLRRATAGPKT